MAYIDVLTGLGAGGGIIGGVITGFQIDMTSGVLDGNTYLGGIEYRAAELTGSGVEYMDMLGDPLNLVIIYEGNVLRQQNRVSTFPVVEFTDGELSGFNLALTDTYNGGTTFLIEISDGNNGAGALVNYTVTTDQSVETGSGLVSFIPIPTPGPTALLSIAAITATRRRRR